MATGRSLVLSCLALVCLLTGPRPAQAATTSVTDGFAAFEAAWRAGNADDLVLCMAERGRLTVSLMQRPFRASKKYDMLRDRARQSFRDYFRHVGSRQLVDRTPANQQRSTPTVRIYDFTYRPKGRNALTTRLQVRLAREGQEGYVLSAVLESPKPPKPKPPVRPPVEGESGERSEGTPPSKPAPAQPGR